MVRINLKLILVVAIVMSTISLAYDGDIALQCQDKPNFNIGEKEYCLGSIPQAFANEEFKCISYISYGSEVLQTNPQYKEKAQTFLSLFSTEQETRQFFPNANSLVNFYYTKKNLHTDYNYTIELICNSANSSLHGNKTVQIDLENLDFVFARTDWGMRNAPYIIGGVLLSIVLVVTIMLMFGWMRK